MYSHHECGNMARLEHVGARAAVEIRKRNQKKVSNIRGGSNMARVECAGVHVAAGQKNNRFTYVYISIYIGMFI